MTSSTLADKKQQLKLSPRHFGRRLTEKQFLSAEYEPGYHYELIEGRLYVVTLPQQPHDWLEKWLYDLLNNYVQDHSTVINRVTNKSVVYVPGSKETTRPEPDIAAYHDFPLERGPDVKWEEVSPLLVIEILSQGGLEKDLERNVRLFARVPSIREYWVVDGLANPREPTLIVRQKKSGSWIVKSVPFDEVYATKLLPGFELRVNPVIV